jgi:DNA-binding beta-propeller fold protein YncE
VANAVLGQPDFTSNQPNNRTLAGRSRLGVADTPVQASLYFPAGIDVVSPFGIVWVADTSNNRVVGYTDAASFESGQPAAYVVGQPDFTTGSKGTAADKLAAPYGVAVDPLGNLYVADTENHRVVVFFNQPTPITNGQAAQLVLGQGDFISNQPNNPAPPINGLGASSLYYPVAVAVTATSTLTRIAVADAYNHRVLIWEITPPNSIYDLADGAPASYVLGQANFIENLQNRDSKGVADNSLYYPWGVTFDTGGNLWVSDRDNHRVLRFDLPFFNGKSASLVIGQPNFTSGQQNQGLPPGPHTLNYPWGVTVDDGNNLYVADHDNHRVLLFQSPQFNGMPASVVYGQPTLTSTTPNYPSLSASSLAFPADVAVDGNRNVYVSDRGNNRALRFNGAPLGAPPTPTPTPSPPPPPTPTPVATFGAAAAAAIGQPGLTSGQPNTDQFHPERAGATTLRGPMAVATDTLTGRLWVADTGNHRVLGYDNASQFYTGQAARLVVGQPDFISTGANTGGLSASSLFSPTGVTVDASGNLWVADEGNHRVLRFPAAQFPLTPTTAAGFTADLVLGQPNFTSAVPNNSASPINGCSASSLNSPRGLLWALGRLYVADQGNDRVLIFDGTTLASQAAAFAVLGRPDFTSCSSSSSPMATTLSRPSSVALDGNGRLYVGDTGFHRVLGFNGVAAYQVLTPPTFPVSADLVIGQPDLTSATTNNPALTADARINLPYVATDAQNGLAVSDFGNHRILIFASPVISGDTAERAIGQPNFTTLSPGISATKLRNPAGLLVWPGTDVIVADSGNHRVLRFGLPNSLQTFPPSGPLSPQGLQPLSGGGGPPPPSAYRHAEAVLGQPNFGTEHKGTSSTRISEPMGVATDSVTNRLYVVDYENHRVLIYANQATFFNGQPAIGVIGQPTFFTKNAGTTSSSLRHPIGVAVDPVSGAVWVADTENNRVLRFRGTGGSCPVICPPPLFGATADLVLGQPNFTSGQDNNPALASGAQRLYRPHAVAVGPNGVGGQAVIVADTNNHRVLIWDNPTTNGQAADKRLGQQTFDTPGIQNQGAIPPNETSNRGMYYPKGVAVDNAGNVYVADTYNHRILVFNGPISAFPTLTTKTANRVLGQANFNLRKENWPFLSAASLKYPVSLAVNRGTGDLYVMDSGNFRVVFFKGQVVSGQAAIKVYGQPNFFSASATVSPPTTFSTYNEWGVAITSNGKLIVTDKQNARVLRYAN